MDLEHLFHIRLQLFQTYNLVPEMYWPNPVYDGSYPNEGCEAPDIGDLYTELAVVN